MQKNILYDSMEDIQKQYLSLLKQFQKVDEENAIYIIDSIKNFWFLKKKLIEVFLNNYSNHFDTCAFLCGSYINTFMEHPGTYIIRCIKAPDGYAPFSDITVKTVTNEYGYPEIEILDDNGNDVKIRGFYGDTPIYYHKDINPALIEISLKRNSAASGVSGGAVPVGYVSGNVENASPANTKWSDAKVVSAAKTGDGNNTAAYLAAAGAVVAAAAGAVIVRKRKKED